MDSRCKKFADLLAELHPRLKNVCEECYAYWEPDEPPVTVLFSELGDRIFDEFDNLDVDEKCEIFQSIESALVSEEEPLSTAVATGLVEAMASKCFSQEERWKQVEKFLGESSLKHAKAWIGE